MPMLHGPALKNRMLLAPLTTKQSEPDGTANEHDFAWIEKVAAGGHSMVMTCATNIQRNGISFPGELGIYDDRQLEGLARIAKIIRSHGASSSVQLHHGGVRSLGGSYGQPVGPSTEPASGARTLTTAEVEGLRDDFIAAALRAESAGFQGVEIHGAFGFVITEFLSSAFNRRTDRYGGSLENRSRLLFEILDGVRDATGTDFQLGLRLSMERYGQRLDELRDVSAELMRRQSIDYLDLAPWDVSKVSEEHEFVGRRIIDIFTELPRNGVRIGASGGLLTSDDAQAALDAGLDFVMLGRASIANPDFPRLVEKTGSATTPLPILRSTLDRLGYSDAYIEYLMTYRGFAA